MIVDPALPLASLLPIRLLVVTLHCLRTTRLQTFHQGPVSAYVRGLMGSPGDLFNHRFRIDVPENGRQRYGTGDLYRFAVYSLADGEPLLERLIAALRSLPSSAPRSAAPVPFADNWALYSLDDGFGEQAVTGGASSLIPYDLDALEQEYALWADLPRFQVRFLTPARLRRDKQLIDKDNSFPYCRDASDLSPQLFLSRVHDSLADLIHRRGGERVPRGQPPQLHCLRAHLFWLDVDYTPARGKPQVMGGVCGRLEFSGNLSPAWWRLLLLGQLIGIGQRAAFGQGRYQLLTVDGDFSRPRVLPATSMLARAADPEQLAEAWRHVVGGSDLFPTDPDDAEPGVEWIDADEQEPDAQDGAEAEADELAAPIEDLTRAIGHLQEGKYRVPELRGYLLPKRDGGLRPLAVPPLRDRVLQRAVQQTLGRGIEPLFSSGSHGYRPGHSRITAADAIRAAWAQGYRWVYESDVRDFFDSVDLQRLRERLEAIYGDDPVVAAVLGWMRAPVRFRGERIERRNGLPQGSPLSPLMANLMLDDFDSDMQAAGFRLIRFADDFIVLCKDPEEARRAGEAARASLAEQGLALHPDKTRITAMEDGFRYLGYLFINDLVLDVGGQRGAEIDKLGRTLESELEQVPPNSWLANLASRPIVDVGRKTALQHLIERVATQRAATLGERDDLGAVLCVTGDPCVIVSRDKHLRVLRDDRALYHLPWSSLATVLLFGNHQITTPAMQQALRRDIPIHLATGMGSYRGVLWSGSPREPGQNLWLRQAALFADPEQCLIAAIAIVSARLRHMKRHCGCAMPQARMPSMQRCALRARPAPSKVCAVSRAAPRVPTTSASAPRCRPHSPSSDAAAVRRGIPSTLCCRSVTLCSTAIPRPWCAPSACCPGGVSTIKAAVATRPWPPI